MMSLIDKHLKGLQEDIYSIYSKLQNAITVIRLPAFLCHASIYSYAKPDHSFAPLGL